MASLNRVFLVGNVTRDIEVRYTSSGTAVADIGLAVNENYKNKAGELIETTVFVDISVWGRQAETSAEYLSKGSPVLIEGRLQLDQWEKDGKKHSRLRVKADRVQFLGRPKRGEYGDAPASAPAPSSSPSAPSAPQDTPQDTPPSAPPSGDHGDDDNLPF